MAKEHRGGNYDENDNLLQKKGDYHMMMGIALCTCVIVKVLFKIHLIVAPCLGPFL